METFSFNPPINLVDEEKWLLAVTSFEATNFVFNVADEDNSFSFIILGRWRIPNYSDEDFIDNLNKLLKLKSKNDVEFHVEEVRNRENKIKVISKEFSSSDFNTSKEEILEVYKKTI